MSDEKPKVYCFLSTISGYRHGEAYGIAEDGTVLANHGCSHEDFVPGDLGVEETGWNREHYEAHYPEGFEAVFVRVDEIPTHKGLKAATAAAFYQNLEMRKQLEALQTNSPPITEPAAEEQSDWERVCDGTARLAVPGGWIYAVDTNDGSDRPVFVPAAAET